MSEKKVADWERIEQFYRAGLLSVREIASTCTVSHVAIHKRAKRDGWTRDLTERIQKKADALVNTHQVNSVVNTESVVTERGIVDANAQVIANIRITHRTDIARSRRLANKLLDELEGLTDSGADIAELIDELRNAEEGSEAMLKLCSKMSSLPVRTKTMKDLADTLKTLVGLERDAFDIAPPSKLDSPAGLDDLPPPVYRIVTE